MKNDYAIVILAAGKGKRMHSPLPKPLNIVAGKAILAHIVTTVKDISPAQIIIVYSGDLSLYKAYITDSDVTWVEQQQQLGTAHAVAAALPYINASQSLVLCGDTPLVPSCELIRLLEQSKNSVGLITATPENPFGFGRIIRNKNNNLSAITEEKDASDAEKKIKEISTGIITAPTKFLTQALKLIKNNNNQGEYYLPAIIPLWLQHNAKVVTVAATDPMTVLGINNFVELAKLENYYQLQIANKLMIKGVRITKPESFNCHGTINADAGVKIANNVTIKGIVTLKAGCEIEANCILEDATIEENAIIKASSIVIGSLISKNAQIGPFAYVRANCNIKKDAKLGAFVEAKNTTLGDGSKANHLSYLGDAEIGTGVNIGAGTITCNYDGKTKHKTKIEDNAFIGSGTELVAPLTINKGSYIGAGSCITNDTPAEKLTIARSRQVVIDKWSEKQQENDKN